MENTFRLQLFSLLADMQKDINMATINQLRENILNLMLKYKDNSESKRLVELYEAITQDYYENLMTGMQSARNNPIYRNHIADKIPYANIQISDKFKWEYSDTKYLDRQATLLESKWIQFARDPEKMADYILNDLVRDVEHQILRDIRLSITGTGKYHYLDMDEKGISTACHGCLV